jgi:integrase-like protein
MIFSAALAMAVAVRGGHEPVAGVVVLTDQGSEYTAGPFRAACTRLGITQSMGRAGSALDNAVIESWHSTRKFELCRLEQFTTKAQVRTALVLDRGLQPRPAALRDRQGLPDRRRAGAARPRRCRPGAGSMTGFLLCRRSLASSSPGQGHALRSAYRQP